MCSWCKVYRRLHTFRKMYRHCWTVYVHCWTVYIYPFGCSFLIHQAGWPVGWNWLLPPWPCVMPIQVQVPIQLEVQANNFNWHQPVALAGFPAPPPPLPLGFAVLAPGLGACGHLEPWQIFDIEVMYFDIEAWIPIYLYQYIGLTKLRYWSTFLWLRYRALYWTAKSKSIDFDIDVSYFTQLQYHSV